jgi:hypothetical protein
MKVETGVMAASAMTEEELIFAWRFEQLQRVGFDTGLALDLAVCAEVDLHDATELVQRGCAPVLAAQILL